MSDGIYRETESLIVAVRVAMRELENASMGAVGDNGPSLDEMNLRVARTGQPWEGNADYETMQRAWRILEAGLREYVDNVSGQPRLAQEKPFYRTMATDSTGHNATGIRPQNDAGIVGHNAEREVRT